MHHYNGTPPYNYFYILLYTFLTAFRHTHTHRKVKKCKHNKVFNCMPGKHTDISYSQQKDERLSINSAADFLPKAQRSQLSSTAPPTNCTCTFSLILACLQQDSGWNTRVSGENRSHHLYDIKQ